MTQVITEATTPTQSARTVFQDFWTLIGGSNDGNRRLALDLLNPGIDVKISGIAPMSINMMLQFMVRWYKLCGELGSPLAGQQLEVTEFPEASTVVVVIQSSYQLEGNRVVPLYHHEAGAHQAIFTHRVRLDQDSRIIYWAVFVEDDSLIERIR